MSVVNNTSRHLRLLGIAALITLATALTSHVIGYGRDVLHVHAFTDALRLGYYVAALLAAATAATGLALLRKHGGERRRSKRWVPIAVTVVVSFVGADFAAGLSNTAIGAYTSRGAYTFVSAPALHPPIVRREVTQPGPLAKGYIFTTNFYDPTQQGTMVGQSGPLILDQQLSPVWFQPVPESVIAANLTLQTYERRPVLAWWQGVINGDGTTTSGEYVVVNQHYRPVARLHGADGWVLALHEFVIRGDDAWVTAGKDVSVNLSRYGGPRKGVVSDSAVQEYNLKTGQLLRSWDALAHIPLADSWATVPTNGSWDAYHLNSIDLLGDGSFVASMRNTWAAYKVNIATGRIEWTLGGKHSSFRFASGAAFQWQHNVTVYPGTPYVTVFDDACCQTTAAGKLVASGPSRGVVLRFDRATHTATMAGQYTHGTNFHTEFMGNIQPLQGGNELVGWGSQGRFSEYTASGRMLLDAVLPTPDVTYRALLERWVGLPLYPPSGAAQVSHGTTTVYASWNGATQVVAWRVLAGSTSGDLLPVTTASKTGFETAIAVPLTDHAFRVQALDRRGRVLGTSSPFAIGS